MFMRACVVVLAAWASAIFAGCIRGESHAMAVEAQSPRMLATWRMKAAERFTREEWREFDAALQELRLRVMADREATGSAAIEEAICRRINGRTFRDVLAAGYEAKLNRLEPIRTELKNAIDGNALLIPKPGDPASAKHLDGIRERQVQRLIAVDAEIDTAEERLAVLRDGTAPADAARKRTHPRDVLPSELSRNEAKEQIATLIAELRAGAVLKYGAWPMKLDRSGAELPEPERTDFLERQTAAVKNGHDVIAVRLRGRWWIYDAPRQSPAFSAAVVANLSDADRRRIEEQWSLLQAELWARKKANEEIQ